MAAVTLKGNTIHTSGTLPAIGTNSSDHSFVDQNLSEVKLSDFKGKRLVLNIFPSVDTGTCAASVRAFNQKASSLDNVQVLCISKDLPFAFARFCAAEGIENVQCLSDFRSDTFAETYGLNFVDGPLQGLLARAIVVLDEEGKVTYTEQVGEIVDEPDYDAAIASL